MVLHRKAFDCVEGDVSSGVPSWPLSLPLPLSLVLTLALSFDHDEEHPPPLGC